MKARFLGVDKKDYVNPKTNRSGTEFILQLHDGEAARLIRVPEDKAKEFARVEPMQEVEIVFGFANGNFGQHYPVVESLEPVRTPAKAG